MLWSRVHGSANWQRLWGGFLLSCAAQASSGADFLQAPSVGDFGGVGLLQTPTARFAEAGELVFGGTGVSPYNRFYFTVQVTPWLEGTIRYTEVTNRLYGPPEFSGDQTYKDRGIDAKLRIFEEGAYRPALAVGLRDVGGTALFSGEYLVASKRFYDLDFSLGLGWGYVGNRGGIPNPLGLLSGRFDQPREQGLAPGQQPGGLNLGRLFTGEEVALFGGIEYRTPVAGLTLKLEYDGNDYRNEPQDNDQPVSSPFNVGLTYRPFNWLDLSLGWERGNTAMLQVAVRSNLNRDKGVPKFDPAPTPVARRPWSPGKTVPAPTPPAGPSAGPGAAGSDAPLPAGVVGGLPGDPPPLPRMLTALANGGFDVDAVDLSVTEATAFLSQNTFRPVPQGLGRAARILAAEVPDTVEALTLANLESGVETARVTLMRGALEQAANHLGSAEELWASAEIGRGDGRIPATALFNPDRYPSYDWSFSPALRQQIGGPDEFYFWQLWARLRGEVEFTRGLSLTGILGFDIANNLSGLRLESDSVLPRVRSDIKKYLQGSDLWLARLQGDYVWQPATDWYARASAGIFEEMFGGVGGELLYRPFDSRLALGADLNWVRQRDYDGGFGFLDYDVVTGHASLYWDTPFHDLLATVRVGRYLAGDAGVTFDVARRFHNGAVFGAFATFTDVSAEDFGEGSFDKGFYLSVPLDLFFTRARRGYAGITWRPLTRDGGQAVVVGKRLHGLTEPSHLGALARDWGRILD